MALYNKTTVTVQGRKALADSFVNGVPIKFLRIEVGSGFVPAQIENLTSLVSKVANLSITKYSEAQEGMCFIRGTLRNNSIQESFKLSEIGVIAQVGDGPEILFSYAYSSDGDLIPATGATSLMEKVIILSLVVGSANVIFQNIDPTAAATIQDIVDLEASLNIEAIRASIAEAQRELETIKADITQNAEGYVKKAGDTMTGDLTAPKFHGDLTGSAAKWSQWQFFDSFVDLNGAVSGLLTNTSSIHDIITKMPVRSKFMVYYPTETSTVPFSGILDIQKISDSYALALFTGTDGRSWSGAWSNKVWTGWHETVSVPVGSIIPFAGNSSGSAPVGYMFPHGQTLSRTQYPALFAILGTTYNKDEDATNTAIFRLPDTRGQFLRGLDNGRGLDPDRTLGSSQSDAIRNIIGVVGDGANGYGFNVGATSGTFYISHQYNGTIGGGGQTTYNRISFDASRRVPTAEENRPKNIALNYLIKY